MGIFNFLFKTKKKSRNNEPQQEIASEIKEEYKGPLPIAETSYSVTREEKHGIFEYIDFKIAGTSFYQKAIKKAIQQEKENSIFFDEKYEGMTNKEILEETYDEPIFEYGGALFSNCSLQLEPDNEYDAKAIAVYIDSFMVGHVPKKNFSEGKEYVYGQLTGDLKNNQKLNFSVSLKGGKYKINRNDEKVDIGESEYRLDGQVTIKTEYN
ncbi:HIRAN domain-containing protein [Oceanobacillus jeddahense]|uniref:HIRAN domain-containing protein n=1 Tax=Oceanobacillus jeddahense TaxID=1462527 RepID=UPI0005959FE0|nr:HIRAN domain-containing protein [Oceanobacillus jeddahense]